MRRGNGRLWLPFAAVLAFYVALAAGVSSQEPLNALEKTAYAPGQAIPVSCLNRTIDTGEHITDASGQLQYVPFMTCNETGRPLELFFGVEKEINCTIEFVDDPLFHLFEFYVHNDAPLTCRIPTRPLPSSSYAVSDPSSQSGAMGSQSTLYTPLIIALSGTLQLSHLHISNSLNLLLHAAPKATTPGTIDSAIAYSVSPATRNTRVSIGDPLTLQFSVRWYPSPALPSGWGGVGGHLYVSTLVYCALSAGAAVAVCFAWFRGVELPRRLKTYKGDRLGGEGMGRFGNSYNGYGYGVGGGYGIGKKD